MHLSASKKIARPRQIYNGHTKRDFVPLAKRM
jgi:citrate synthase